MTYRDPVKRSECQRRFYARNRERVLAKNAEYRASNRERIRERNAAYRAAKRGAILEKQALWRASERGKQYQTGYSAKYYADPHRRMRLLLGGARQRAKRRGLPFDECLAGQLESSPPEQCACCHRDFDYSMGRGRNKRDASPSLDRISNDGGYVSGNVAVICMRCNHVKGDAKLSEMEKVVSYLGRAVVGPWLGNVAHTWGERRAGNISVS
jgi:hypothetical protein